MQIAGVDAIEHVSSSGPDYPDCRKWADSSNELVHA